MTNIRFGLGPDEHPHLDVAKPVLNEALIEEHDRKAIRSFIGKAAVSALVVAGSAAALVGIGRAFDSNMDQIQRGPQPEQIDPNSTEAQVADNQRLGTEVEIPTENE